jgi:hypothetical protein
VLGLLLAFQTALACGPTALCRLLEAAAAANQVAMLAPGGYGATIETETAIIGRREGRIEGATTLEQTSSRARWSSDGGFEQHVVGSRSFPNAIPLSRIAFLRIGWVVPMLVGERLQVITRTGPRDAEFSETMRGSMAPEIVVHPLSSDRERYYTYSGGMRVQREIAGVMREVVAVEVLPVAQLPREETLFEGEMDIDPASNAVVRLIGRIKVVGRAKRGFMNLGEMFDPTVTLVNLENQPAANGAWIPAAQRFEIQTASSRASGFGAARRVISRFHDVAPLARGTEPVAIAASTAGYLLTSAPGDSLRGFRSWYARAGQVTEQVSETDFSQFRPDRQQPAGRPSLVIQGYRSGDFLRINRIEGLYTGISVIARMRDAAPGLSFRALGGYAWSEKTVRGGAGFGYQTGPWLLEGGGLRVLDVTNKFRNQFDNPEKGGLAGRDPWDYVDRRGVGLGATRSLGGSRGSILRFDAARVSDHAVSKHMNKSVFGGRLRQNRGIYEGDYWRGTLLLDWNPLVSPLFARDGVGFQGEVEAASGDLDYTRVEGRVVLRKSLTRVFFIARLHAGAVLGATPPPQQLFELGGSASFPGYNYKEFAGTRAALFRMRLSYPLAVLDVPFRFGSGLTLPSLAPAISLGFQAGITDAGSPGGLAAVRALGDKRDDKTGELVLDPLTGDPLPAAVPIDRVKTSIDIRIGFFGDALAVGFARALERGRSTRFIFAFGRQF